MYTTTRILCAAFLALVAAAPASAQQPLVRHLNEALDAALEQAPELREAAWRETRAYRDVAVARSAFAPTVTVNGSVTRNRADVQINGSAFLQRWDQNASIEARLQLFDPVDVPALRAARADEAAVLATTPDTVAEVRYTVASLYLDALAADAVVRVREQDVDTRRDTADVLARAAALGDARAVDVERAELEWLQAGAALADAVAVRDAAVVALEAWTGWVALDAAALAPVDLAAAEAPDERASDQRLDAREDALRHRWRLQRWAAAPSIALVGRSDFGRPSLRAPEGVDWTVTLQLSWTVFDWSRVQRARLARVGREEPSFERETLERARTIERRRADAREAAAVERLSVARRAVEQAARVRATTSRALELGDATALELAEADDDVVRAELERAIAEVDVQRALLDRAFAIGALEGDDAWID